jgi:hypothetical protein
MSSGTPIASATTFKVNPNSQTNVPAPGVLGPDSNYTTIASYGDPATAQTVLGPPLSAPTHDSGTVCLSADGSFTYTPPSGGLTVSDSFRYVLQNQPSERAAALVTLLPGYPPVAANNSYSAFLNVPLTVPAPGVLAGATLNGGQISNYGPLGIVQTVLGQPAPTAQGGSVTLNGDGQGGFTYTPPTGFTGADSFKYIIENADGASGATVTLPVAACTVTLVKLDGSDCVNSNVQGILASNPNLASGTVVLTGNAGNIQVNVTLTNRTPNTQYQFFLKCVQQLGTVQTDSTGAGQNSFTFAASLIKAGPYFPSDQLFAFDMYPAGAPSGDKYQSVQASKAQLAL